MEFRHKMWKSHWGVKYRSRSLGQGTCRVCTLRSTMKGLVVVGFIVEEIWNIDVKYVKVTGAQKYRSRLPGQGTCQVSTVHAGEALCKVWWL